MYDKHKGIALGFDDWGPSQTSYSYHIQSTHIKGVLFDVVYMLVVVIFLQRLHLLHQKHPISNLRTQRADIGVGLHPYDLQPL